MTVDQEFQLVHELDHRNFVNALEEKTKKNPDQVYGIRAVSARTISSPDGWEPITYGQLSNAVNHIAYTLIEKHGTAPGYDPAVGPVPPAPGTFPTVAYIGPNDARYVAFMLGAIKAGYQALFVSPRNSRKGQLNLLAVTDCRAVWASASHRPLVDSWLQPAAHHSHGDHGADSVAHFEPVTMPDLATLLDTQNNAARPFPYHKTFAEFAWDPNVVLHTSGTTGLPKPIVVRQGVWAQADFGRPESISMFTGRPRSEEHDLHVLSPMPFFHASGLIASTQMALINGMTFVFPPTDRPITSDLVLECMQHTRVDVLFVPPSILSEISELPDGVEALQRLSRVVFTGGGLPRETGHKLAKKGVKLANMIGSTECLYPLLAQPDPKLWEYFIFRMDEMNAEWRPVDGSGDLCELVFVRPESHVTDSKHRREPHESIFYTFPDLQEWSTNDIYQRHPTLKNHWRYYARKDNIIVFSNGEKLNPEDIEQAVTACPGVRGAMVVGRNRFQAGLIVEPVRPMNAESPEASKFFDRVWEVVAEINEDTVAHGRISRPMIIYTSPDKPFPRSGKGSIQREAAMKLYAEEVNALYARFEGEAGQLGNGDQAVEDGDVRKLPRIDLSSREALAASIRNIIIERLNVLPEMLSVDGDLFAQAGLDSLQAINAARLLREGLQAALPPARAAAVDGTVCAPRTIYGHPSPAALADYFWHMLNSQTNDDGATGEALELNAMQALIAKYTTGLPSACISQSKPLPRQTGQVILLTGTTGSLGAYLLDALLHDKAVARVIALNRDADGGRARQVTVSAARGLATDQFDARVTFAHADLARPHLGLNPTVYQQLLADVDRVVHNAWPVHFNYGVGTFEPSIAGVRRLVNLSAEAVRRVPIVFVSSISTALGASPTPVVPEESIHDLNAAIMGYGRSKMVSSRILDAAAEESGIPTVSVRVGQIGGPRSHTAGKWNPQELLPSIVASSVYMGMLPTSIGFMGHVDWVPVEDVAGTLLDLAGLHANPDLDGPVTRQQYYHCINPHVVQWRDLLPAMRDIYGDRITATVSFREWFAKLQEYALKADSGHDGDSLATKNPCIKLIDTLASFLDEEDSETGPTIFAFDKTVQRSPTLANLGAITTDLMKTWCIQWDY